jgi:patatin-like phospholipase/acyl hydrolase
MEPMSFEDGLTDEERQRLGKLEDYEVERARKLRSPGPKRILALDGGGIRGALTLGFLERLQQLLRARHGDPGLRLSDYFDLIGGTSTGSIIAGALALGHEVAKVKDDYLKLGGRVFKKHPKWKFWKATRALFDHRNLEEELKKLFVDRSLADPSVKTGLCIVTQRADTGSTWPLMNNPLLKYHYFNRDMYLRDLIRASTAAPVYFAPQKLLVKRGRDMTPDQYGAFVDGGVSMANNPSLQLFLAATLKGFSLNWPRGADKLLLVSVGTGHWRRKNRVDVVTNSRLWDWAREVPSMLMEDASWHNQSILQFLSDSPTAFTIDRQIGNLSEDLLTDKPALSYLRYSVALEKDELEKIGVNVSEADAVSLREMSEGKNRARLAEIGERAAAKQVSADHLPAAFDLR